MIMPQSFGVNAMHKQDFKPDSCLDWLQGRTFFSSAVVDQKRNINNSRKFMLMFYQVRITRTKADSTPEG